MQENCETSPIYRQMDKRLFRIIIIIDEIIARVNFKVKLHFISTLHSLVTLK